LYAAASLTAAEAGRRAVLKTGILIRAEDASAAQEKPEKSLRPECCNADRVRGRKLEPKKFLIENGFDI
jgi:hypothetical protein